MGYTVYWNEDKNLYYFTTKNGLIYEVSFIEDCTLDFGSDRGIDNVFQIVLEQVNCLENKHVHDGEIVLTVKNLLNDFFAINRQSSLIYVCDDTDNRALVRCVLFDIWFRRFGINDIIKVNKVISVEGKSIYTSSLIHREHLELDNIINRHDNLEQSFK